MRTTAPTSGFPTLALAAALALGVPAVAGPADALHPHWYLVSIGVREPGPAVFTGVGRRPCLVVTDAGPRELTRVFLDDGRTQVMAGDVPEGKAPRPGTAAGTALVKPWGLARESGGGLLAADAGCHRVFRFTPEGKAEVVVGSYERGMADFSGGKARLGAEVELDEPTLVAVGPEGIVYVADAGNHRILAVGKDGQTRPVAGTGAPPRGGEDKAGGAPLETPIGRPLGLAVDGEGALLIATARPGRIWRLDGRGGMAMLQAVPRLSPAGPFHGFLTEAKGKPPAIANPASLAVGEHGALYFADLGRDRLLRLTPKGALESIQLPWHGTGEPIQLTSVSALPQGGLVVTARERIWITFPGRDDGHASGEALFDLAGKAIKLGLAGDQAGLDAGLKEIRSGAFIQRRHPIPGDGKRNAFRSMVACLHVHNQVQLGKWAKAGPAASAWDFPASLPEWIAEGMDDASGSTGEARPSMGSAASAGPPAHPDPMAAGAGAGGAVEAKAAPRRAPSPDPEATQTQPLFPFAAPSPQSADTPSPATGVPSAVPAAQPERPDEGYDPEVLTQDPAWGMDLNLD
jgi:hypothetical protein